MRAVLASRYGGPEVLDLGERPDPKIGPDTVLVRVRAASINPVDWKIVKGYLDGAWPVIFPLTPGWDVAGEVVAAGPAVTHVHPGDRVFGYARRDFTGEGTWAQLAAVPARGIALMPEQTDFAAASGLPLAGLTAYQCLADKARVSSGDSVLVHAASGGVGSMAVQIARALGAARVIGTTSERNFDYVRGLGAEPVAYGDGLAARVRELAPDGVDAVVDLAGGEALAASAELVTNRHRVVSVVDAAGVTALGGQYVFVRPDVAGLDQLARWADAGQLRVHVEAEFGLDRVREAVEQAMAGHTRGKLVLTVD